MEKDKSSRGFIYASYIGAVIVLMDLTAVNIALPSISHEYSAGMNDVSWVLMASMLTASGFALVAGRLIELVDPRRLFIYSLLGFTLFTFLSFLSRSLMMLIILRFIQGFFESAIYVIGPALIRKLLPGEKRQSSYGIWMMCTGIGISLGPLIGGLLTSLAGWHYVFLINIPLCLLAVVVLLRNSTRMQVSRKKIPMDFPGAVLSFLFLAGVIFSLNMVSRYGWTDFRILTAIALSILSLLIFVIHEKRSAYPVFEFSLFREPNFLLSNLGFFIYFLANVGSRFLRPFYFEQGRGFEADVSGLLMMVSPMLMILVSPLAKSMSAHTGPRMLNISGTVLLIIAMFMFSGWDQQTSFLYLLLSMLVLGIGMGLYYPTNAYLGMQDLPDQNFGMGSAAISTSKSLGKLAGVLVFALIFSHYQPDVKSIPDPGAFQNTFLAGAGISCIALLFALLMHNNVDKGTGSNNRSA